jgi:leader peptidase (prepilin peptidase)/N-methyltransferase
MVDGVQWVVAVVYAGFLAGSGALAVIDARTHRLPNRLMFPLYGFGAAGLVLASAIGHEWSRLVVAAFSAALLFGFFWLLWFFGPVGYGDVKLVGMLGLFLGWAGLNVAGEGILLGMLAATLAAVGLLLARRVNRKSRLAYGPYLIAGCWLALGLHQLPAVVR